MSEYNHRMTLVVPESLMTQANQLALIAGESSSDVNTFTSANYTDKNNNLYSVCSTVIKPIVLGMLGVSLADKPLPDHAFFADVELAQYALDNSVMYAEGSTILDPSKIIIGIDIEPLLLFETLGVEPVNYNLEDLI